MGGLRACLRCRVRLRTGPERTGGNAFMPLCREGSRPVCPSSPGLGRKPWHSRGKSSTVFWTFGGIDGCGWGTAPFEIAGGIDMACALDRIRNLLRAAYVAHWWWREATPNRGTYDGLVVPHNGPFEVIRAVGSCYGCTSSVPTRRGRRLRYSERPV